MALEGVDIALAMWIGFVVLVFIGVFLQIILDILREKRMLELARRPYNHRTIHEPMHLDNIPNESAHYHSNTFWQAYNEP